MSCVQLLATMNNASFNLHGMVSGEHVFLILWPQTRVDVIDFLSLILFMLNVPCFMWRVVFFPLLVA